jgi:uncharacterized protein
VALKFSFFPRDEQFFALFNRMADEIRAAAGLLEEMLATDPLDNVMDAIDHAAVLVRLYRITKVLPGARELTRTVSSSAARLDDALDALEKRKPVQPHAVEINRLENEADRAYQNALQTLFDTQTDPILIIKWKEVFDMLELITDACEDVANVIEGVVVKHG